MSPNEEKMLIEYMFISRKFKDRLKNVNVPGRTPGGMLDHFLVVGKLVKT